MSLHRWIAEPTARALGNCAVALVLPALVVSSATAQTSTSESRGDQRETIALPSTQVVSPVSDATTTPPTNPTVPAAASSGPEGPYTPPLDPLAVNASRNPVGGSNGAREAPIQREDRSNDVARAEPNAQPQPNWFVGAGLTFGGIGQSADAAVMSNGIYLGITTIVPTVAPLAFLEYRASNGLFLFVQPEGYYTQNKFENETKTRYSAGHSIGPGLRWVANPAGLVEFGMSHLVYVAATYSRMPTATSQAGATVSNGGLVWAAPTSQSLGTATAFVAERMLLPQLSVRVAATFFRAYLSKTTMIYESEQGERSRAYSSGASIRFGFEPAITLRLAF